MTQLILGAIAFIGFFSMWVVIPSLVKKRFDPSLNSEEETY